MRSIGSRDATRPAPDAVLVAIADYVMGFTAESVEARDTARYCLMDSLGCALLALEFPACAARLGPLVPGAELAGGARVPGTGFVLDPVKAAFDIGTLIRWLDFNDTWLAAEWGHPSDNLGAILAVADYVSRRPGPDRRRLRMSDVLTAMIQAHEIQGVLALENAFNRVGLDHVLLVRIASTAVATRLLGGDREAIIAAVSNAWLDGGALRSYRHAPNTGPRKSWAAGDATSRGVRHALMALAGEPGYPSALTADVWGFEAALMRGEPIRLGQPLGSYVMEHVLFKIAYPAEFHAQTAVEAALELHPAVLDRLDRIESITLETQEAACRIIDKTGPLANPADRDHCLQYMVAVALLHGSLTAEHYEDEAAADPRIDALRARMQVVENPAFTEAYFDPARRAIGNAVQVRFTDGTETRRVAIDYPLGHRRRRAEGLPLLLEKFRANVRSRFDDARAAGLESVLADRARLETMPVDEFLALWAEIS